jgi:GT2 family glycosyltransferase/predicted Zn-dependent protease
LAFGPGEGLDLVVQPGDTWEVLQGRLPLDFAPDFVVVSPAYSEVPQAVWEAPIPVVALAPDWNLLWHRYRAVAPRCELLLTDRAGVEAFRAAGVRHVLCANLYGSLEPSKAPQAWAVPRDIDVLFIGNLNPAVQSERLRWLARLASLGERYKVVIRTAVAEDEYWHLLSRAKIVFSQNVSGRWSRRVFEAMAAGALVFHPEETPPLDPLVPGEDYVAYTTCNLESLIETYLSDAHERERIAEHARRRAPDFTWQAQWSDILLRLREHLSELRARVGHRVAAGVDEWLIARAHEAVAVPGPDQSRLIDDLKRRLESSGGDALAVVLAVVAGKHAQVRGPWPQAAEECLQHFEEAVRLVPESLVARLNWAEALALAGRGEMAVEQLRRLLSRVGHGDELSKIDLEAPHFPVAFDTFRVEWERAAWQSHGERLAESTAKRALLLWRAHGLLAELTGNPAHAYEACLLRPDLTAGRAALGQILARTGSPVEAVAHLRRALEENPFDRGAARTLFHVLGAAGDQDLRRRLQEEQRRLAQAAPQVVPPETWFAAPMPAGDELASIIVLCCNRSDVTRLCLESVVRCTRGPYEFILVDNGSTDDTPDVLAEFARRPGPARVEVIRNGTNRGFPAGCNQAIARARGRFLVFLNNDTIVTRDWLKTLIARALHDWPHVGLVGPVTNYAPEPQGVACAYSLQELEAFAARRRQDWAGKVLAVRRLSGFCLLVRREVLDRVGTFDEGFGLGFFDDDDLALRAHQAGYKLLVALDVFVHHFGSQTFHGLGVDTRRLLEENFGRFRAKWGDHYTKGYRPIETGEASGAAARPPAAGGRQAEPPGDGLTPGRQTPSPATPRRRRSSVTLTMIVKNEERNLPACLATAADLVDQIVVVDTGSADGTKEVARQFGAELYEFPWVDDFAAARNECLRYATGDWIIWLDADDRLNEENRRRLAAVFDALGDEPDAYVAKVRSAMDPNGRSVRLLDQVRIFPNHPQIRWEYRIHEQILPSVRRRGGNARWTDVIIDHVGYVDGAVRKQKLERNMRLLEIDNAQRPDDAFTLFNLGWTCLDLGNTDQALRLLRRSLERSAPDSSIVRKLYVLLAQGHRQLGHRVEALALCREGQRRCPDDLELPFEEAQLCRELGDPAAAEQALRRILTMQPGQHFASIDPALRGWRTRHLLACVCLQQGKVAEAESHARQAVRERTDFVPAWLVLADIAINQARWTEVDVVIRHLREECGEPTEALIVSARAALARREFHLARPLLEEAIAAAPGAVGPRVLLTHVLLQEGRDWLAAERALRDVLSLAPEHPEAKHNLELLLRQQGGRAAADPVAC